jgi:hypothetical protein
LPDQETDDMTDQSRRHALSALTIGWRGARKMLLAAAIGFGGWQAAQFDWSDVGRDIDQALWSHALEDRATVSDLQAAVPVWREREGASGDKIVERIVSRDAGKSTVAVLDEMGGEAIPAPVLAEQAAAETATTGFPVEPASFDGLSAGDRLTITTTSGDVFSFEVVTPDSDPADGNIAIRIAEPGGEDGSVLYTIRPVEPDASAALRPQQEL